MSSYRHRYHAGNAGDVLKHALLIEVLNDLVEPKLGRLVYLDTHAGEGRYTLLGTGEWTEGIGRVDAAEPSAELLPFREALARCGAPLRLAGKGGEYPGSPQLALTALRPTDRAVFIERDPETSALLRRLVGSDRRAEVKTGDGLSLAKAVLEGTPSENAVVVHVDPAYTDKTEWTDIVGFLYDLREARPFAVIMLWYPVKSLTRPNALHAALRKSGVAASVVELQVTPLDIERNALNGSGVVLIGATASCVSRCAAIATALGPILATHEGRFTVRTLGWT